MPLLRGEEESSGALVPYVPLPEDIPQPSDCEEDRLVRLDEHARSLVPLPLPSPAMTKSLTLPSTAKRQMAFACGVDQEEDYSFLSLACPGLGEHCTTAKARRNQPSRAKPLSETAMTKSTFLSMSISNGDPSELSPPPTSSVFECKTCHAKFSTFQALGGHRAGHNKLSRQAHQGEDTRTSMQPEITSGRHECSICGKCYPTGQALGGHKRLHRSNTVDATKVEGLDLRLHDAKIGEAVDLDSHRSNVVENEDETALVLHQPSAAEDMTLPTSMYYWI